MIEPQPSGLPAKKTSRTAAIAVSLAAVLIAYLVVRSSVPYLDPALASVLPPEDPSLLARALPYSAADPRERVSSDVHALSRRAAVSAPLAFEPFFVEAKAEEQAGRLDNAIRLMEEARRRRPAFDLTRIHLIGYYQQARRFPELITEIDFVLRRSEEAAQIILPELGKLITDPQGRVALASILARNPAWRARFYEVAAAQPGDPADALTLLNLVQARRPRGGVGPERGFYRHRLVQAGDHRRARAIWLESLPPAERAKNQFLFNGDFRRVAAPAPFGWTVRHEAQGRAEIVTAGAPTPYLDVVYFGGSRVILAEQQLALPPGRYRLSQLAKSDQQPASGQVYWRLTCLPAGNEIGRLRATGLQPQYSRTSTEFAIPASCAGQQLALIGEPGDIAAEIRVQMTRLELARAD